MYNVGKKSCYPPIKEFFSELCGVVSFGKKNSNIHNLCIVAGTILFLPISLEIALAKYLSFKHFAYLSIVLFRHWLIFRNNTSSFVLFWALCYELKFCKSFWSVENEFKLWSFNLHFNRFNCLYLKATSPKTEYHRTVIILFV